MRFALQTWGTEGDVRPFFALGQALVSRGHDVSLTYTSVEARDFQPLARACKLDARPVGETYFRTHREHIDEQLRTALKRSNPLAQLETIFASMMDPVVDEMFTAAEQLCRDCDVFVGHFLLHPAASAAVKYQKKYTALAFAPVLPSRHIPPIGTPKLGRLFNPLLWKFLAFVLDRITLHRVNALRAKHQIPLLRSTVGDGLDTAQLVLTAVSPALFTRPEDWAPHFHVTGFLSLEERSEPWDPPAALRSFLAEGPPVFLSFGSMFSLGADSTNEAVQTLARAATLAKVRAIVQAPASFLSQLPEHPALYKLERAPHQQLFPQCALIVHHGGAGTTQASILAGRPSVVVPHATDQFFWADRLQELGLAPSPLPRTKLTAERLAERIRTVVETPSMQERAQHFASKLREEKGAQQAVTLLEQLALR